MNKLLEFSVRGIKNIDNEVSVSLMRNVKSSKNKIKNIVGIFGYNGSGKTALISGFDVYKNIVLNKNFLAEKETLQELKNITNYKLNKICISVVFKSNEDKIYQHKIEIEDCNIVLEEVFLVDHKDLKKKFNLLSIKNGKLFSCYSKGKKIRQEIDKISSSHSSIVSTFIESNVNKINNETITDEVKFSLFMIFDFAFNLNVCFKEKDYLSVEFLNRIKPRNFVKYYQKLISQVSNQEIRVINNLSNENIIKVKRLEKFIQVFKPSLLTIKRDWKTNSSNNFVFYYQNDIRVPYKNESDGIKQLVKIFDSLYNYAIGQICIIDEIDKNINSIYLTKLIEYLAMNAKGQLIFSAHNLEIMSALKKKKESIINLGNNQSLETWMKIRNSNPINQYKEGYFLNAPNNIEDFDFINVFEGEI